MIFYDHLRICYTFKIIRIFMKWHTGIAFQNTVSYHFVHPGCAFSMPQQPASHMWDIHKIISFLTNLSTKFPDKKLLVSENHATAISMG